MDWDERSPNGRYVRENCKPLHRYIMLPDCEDHRQLFDLVSHLLEYEPANRMSLQEALQHPFFDKLAPAHRLHERDARRSSSAGRGASCSRRRSSGSYSDHSSASSVSSGGGLDPCHHRARNNNNGYSRTQRELNSNVHSSSSSHGLSRF